VTDLDYFPIWIEESERDMNGLGTTNRTLVDFLKLLCTLDLAERLESIDCLSTRHGSSRTLEDNKVDCCDALISQELLALWEEMSEGRTYYWP
jgi:hypothetical protein